MTEDGRSSIETRKWTESLKSKVKSLETTRKGAGLDSDLQDDLLSALDLLCEQAGIEGDFSGFDFEAIPEQIAEALDSSFSHWQQQLTQEFGRSITKELDRQLKHVQQLEKDLEEEREVLEERSRELEERAANVNQREAKIWRQRKSVAKELKAKKLGALLEIERNRMEFRDELRGEAVQECEDLIKNLQDQLASKESRLEAASGDVDSYREEIQALTEKLNITTERLEAAEVAVESDGSANHENAERIDGLENELLEVNRLKGELDEQVANYQIQVTSLEEQLKDLQDKLSEYEDRASSAEKRAESAEESIQDLEERAQLAEDRARDAEQQAKEAEERAAASEAKNASDAAQGESSRVLELVSDLERLQEELDIARQAIEENESCLRDNELPADVQELRARLGELELQNSDLASQLAKAQVNQSASQPHVQFDQESLSWEERKALIIEQLESESDGPPSPSGIEADASRRVEVEEVISSTQKEIEKRDAEIAELRDIVEQQSDTKQGVAIGAAAIAQMLDSDDLVVQERQKLKEIQAQWEEKLRQAEIDVSLERARLARERQQLEAELEEARRSIPERSIPEKDHPQEGRTRKWLDHLGLREEKEQD